MSKRVNFERSSPPSESRSRRSRDSGVGSSSSEQANSGGKSDRRFTDQDREDQRYNVHALQEALDSANKNFKEQKKKNLALDEALSGSHRTIREKETIIRNLIDENKDIKDRLVAALDQIELHKDDFNEMRDQRDDWRQRYLSVTEPVNGIPMMSGGSGESSDGVKRTKSKSKHDTNQTARMKDRINKSNYDEEPSSPKIRRSSSRRRRSLSVANSSRQPYIEEPEDRSRPPLSTRHFPSYTAAPSNSPTIARMEAPTMSNIPRTSYPLISPTYQTAGYQQTGDYVPLPLPPDTRGRRKH